jgi:hypothetical protein
MINLLPPTAKKGILIEYWVRVISVWLMLWSLALIGAASLLLPAYVYTTSQVQSHQESAEQAMKKVTDYQHASVSLERASQQARMIVDEKGEIRFSQYILLIEQLQGAEIQVTTIKLGRDKTDLTPIMVFS